MDFRRTHIFCWFNRSWANIKARATWVDHGVLKEDPEKAEDGDFDAEGGRGLSGDARVLGSFFFLFLSCSFRSCLCLSSFIDEDRE